MQKITFFFLGICCLALFSCEDKTGNGTPTSELDIEDGVPTLDNYSSIPAFVTKQSGFESLEVYSMISSEDELANSPGFIFGGSADGAGLLANTDGTYSFIVNHEDNFSVSRVTLDENLQPVAGEYILNSDGGKWRLCSATLATPEEHGFGPLFITCGESNADSRIHALSPYAEAGSATVSREIPGFGRWKAENAVPLPGSAYSDKTVVVIGDDDSGATSGGQVAMYVSGVVGNLNSGNLYVLKRDDDNTRELDITTGTKVDVSFVQIENHMSLSGEDVSNAAKELNAIQFGRVEDLDYRKGGGANGREVYFNVTGQSGNADRTKYGRVYHLTLDENNPLKGTLEVVLDGDDESGIANQFENPDNICVTENYAYIQEDPNRYNDGADPRFTHDSYLYQYNLATGELKVVFELDHHRGEADESIYNTIQDPKSYYKGAWEYGALIDISETVGSEDTFLLCIQPHTWVKDKFAGVDGGTVRTTQTSAKQGSQVLIIKGLAR